MNVVTKHYNIHDLIGVRIVNHKKVFDRLAHFETDCVENPDVEIILGNFKRPRSPEYKLVDGKYWVGEHSIYCNYRHKLSFWRIWIDGINQSKTTIHFWGDPWFSYELLLMLVLEPLIAYKLSKKGILVLHASSISINKKGCIFTGATGTGKTTIVVRLMNSPNSEYYSDDQAYVHEKTLHSYPLPVGFTKSQVDYCGVKVSARDNCIMTLYKLINIITLGYPNLTRRVELKNIKFKNSLYGFPAGHRVPIDTIFVLSKTTGAPTIQKLSPTLAYRRILEYNEGNEDKLVVFHKFFSVCLREHPNVDYWHDFKKELWKLASSGIRFYEVLLNREYGFDDTLAGILDIVEGER